MSAPRIPRATYRLQFNRDFNFTDATRIVPYLDTLGISHLYASPYLKARAGSTHGYDIVDHNALNPEIGDDTSLAALVDALHTHAMGQILDVVPNHMGVGGDDNAWWLDVLENGQASAYAGYFDIHWHPVKEGLQNKVLLPFLGDHYGTVLERGELKLDFDAATGRFAVRYYEHLFPIDPRTYPLILESRTKHRAEAGLDAGLANELRALLSACASLPRRNDLSAAGRRRRDGPECKRWLAELCGRSRSLVALIRDAVAQLNGTPGRSRSFDRMHRLLEAQAYRLSYWQVAADEINYRRFFDINNLAGIRVEQPEVFAATHGFVFELIANRQVDGLRVDHPDGLQDPHKYYTDLQKGLQEVAAGHRETDPCPIYTIVEKIVASYERLPAHWPVCGTTGYDFAYLVNGLFVYPESQKNFDRLYARFTGLVKNFDEWLYERKKLIVHTQLSSELTVLASLLDAIAQSNRHTRDFTYNGLRDALSEVSACFPVYRTYVTAEMVNEQDRRYVQWAIAQAKKRSPATDIVIFDFVHDMLLLENFTAYPSDVQRRMLRFTLRFQQYTAPVMAKGMEDTTLYIYNRLVSLNDVGFNPNSFGISVAAFHHENAQRLADWPHAMVTTSTHDSKRSEDVRARINVLSEVPDEWRRHVGRWSRINRFKKHLVDGLPAPSRNDEYLLYQTLLGAWPLKPLDATALDAFRERIEAYMLKAAREAKIYTSWINPNLEYENAVRRFVRAVLRDPERNAFLADFVPFQGNVARFGLLNSLSQTLLKLTVPGVPDIYQGNELFTFDLVDPDNRRPVDYELRRSKIEDLIARTRDNSARAATVRALLDPMDDGRAKLYLTWTVLDLRRRHPGVFANGEYLPLSAHGPKAEHVCAFMRHYQETHVITVAARWFARVMDGTDGLPLGEVHWASTRIELPETVHATRYRNVLTGEAVEAVEQDTNYYVKAETLFANFPAALLINDDETGP